MNNESLDFVGGRKPVEQRKYMQLRWRISTVTRLPIAKLQAQVVRWFDIAKFQRRKVAAFITNGNHVRELRTIRLTERQLTSDF